jgi:integrase
MFLPSGLRQQRQQQQQRPPIHYHDKPQSREEMVYAATAATPIDELLKWFREALVARGNVKSYINVTAARCKIVFAQIGAQTIADVTPSAVQSAVAALRNRRTDAPLCNASRNHHFRAVYNFFSMLRADDRIPRNPLSGVLRKYPTKGFEVRPRRTISEADLVRLIEVTENGPVYAASRQKKYRLDGPTRADIYRLCVATGLRAAEVRAIKIEQAALWDDRPGIQVRARQSKNRQSSFQHISPELAVRLRRYVEGRDPTETLFPMIPNRSAHMLRFDLARAGIPYKEGGAFFDFHSLRHECGTLLVARNVNLKVVQQVMRHSTITLTMDRYAHTEERDLLAARDLIPVFLPGDDNKVIITPPPAAPAVPARPPSAKPVMRDPGITETPPVEIFKPQHRNGPRDVWHVRYLTPEGRTIEEPVSSNRELTDEYAANLWTRLERRRTGIVESVYRLPQKRVLYVNDTHPLHSQLPEFEQHLRRLLCERRAVEMCRQCWRVLDELGAAPLTMVSVMGAISQLMDRQANVPLSEKKRRHYLSSMSRLFQWLVERELLASNPLEGQIRHHHARGAGLTAVQKQAVALVAAHGGNVAAAARALGVAKATMQDRLKGARRAARDESSSPTAGGDAAGILGAA